jgi:hypothetical protein
MKIAAVVLVGVVAVGVLLARNQGSQASCPNIGAFPQPLPSMQTKNAYGESTVILQSVNSLDQLQSIANSNHEQISYGFIGNLGYSAYYTMGYNPEGIEVVYLYKCP